MEKNQASNRDYYTIDMMHIVRSIWQRVWIIILAGILSAVAAFGISTFAIKPDYSASILLYVNNSSFSVGNTSLNISASQITAAQSLVKTYTVLLKNRTTLERVAQKANVNYTYREMQDMISAGSANDTEVMSVTVKGKNPYEVAQIANTIAEVLPVRISEIIDGASMEVVDSAIPNTQKIAPSITKNTAIGMLLGVLIVTLVIAIMAMMDDTIHDEEYILQNYDYPILAKIPNLAESHSKGRGYAYGYYYKKNNTDTNH